LRSEIQESHRRDVRECYRLLVRQGNTTFASGTAYYFKVEPIQWRVLSGAGTASGLVVSEKLLTNSVYYTSNDDRKTPENPIHLNNYKYSTLRAMLNGYDGSDYNVANFTNAGFLDAAFTTAEKAYITTTTVDNSAATTEDSSNANACANTNDRIFALSYREYTNTDYFSDNESRYGILSDYARATGTFMLPIPFITGTVGGRARPVRIAP